MRTILLVWLTVLSPLALRAETRIDFATEIMPVLTKAGCNTGACHGAAAGRGGFRLSLYGSEPATDYESLVLELEGRRVNLARPDESLVLLKATETLVHGGGYRLDPDGEGAQRILRWIAAGAERGDSPHLKELELSPRTFLANRVGDTTQLRAVARFDDGSQADVTRWTVFTAEDPAAVSIDPETAVATLQRRGRQIVVARYLDRVMPIELIVPLADEMVDLSAEPRRNFIDEHVLATLATVRLPVAPLADDATFLRRVTLDLTGRLPTLDEQRDFQEDPRADKRDLVIDRLLASPAFTHYWAWRWGELLRIRSRPNDPEGARAYHEWVARQIDRRVGYDELARALLTAQGDTHTVGPANFYRSAGDPREQAELFSELFMGARLRCANCHNHPLDRWTQDDYHGLAAIFAGIERGRVVRISGGGEVLHPRTGEAAVPRLPGGDQLAGDADQRRALADWLTASDNPYFARAVVNRLWKALLGRGLVEPTDDLRATNPATHPPLLDELAADFAAHGYRVRHTLRRIARSSTYQRSAAQLDSQVADDRFYAAARSRPLPAAVLADAIADVTGIAERYGELPLGTRAVDVFDANVESQTLDVLGRCSRDDSCESDTGTTGGLPRMLHLFNGPLLNRRIASPEGRLEQLLAAGREPPQIIDELYHRALGRPPTRVESDYWQSQLDATSGPDDQRKLLQDFLWSLLTCREFTTNH